MSSRSLFFEDWQSGLSTPPVEHTVDAPLVEGFLGLLPFDLPLFHDDAAAQAAGHARRIVPGPVLVSLAMVSVVPSGFLSESLIALVGMDEVRFRHPLHLGDCVCFRNHFVSKRDSSKPDRGLVTLRLEAMNQDGTVLLEFLRTFLVKRRVRAEAA